VNKSIPLSLDQRIERYIAATPPAIAGQRGHDRTFALACTLVNGFALDQAQAIRWMALYNKKCQPMWADTELLHKVSDALRAGHRLPRGHLLSPKNHPADPLEQPSENQQISFKVDLTMPTIRNNPLPTPHTLAHTCVSGRLRMVSMVNHPKITENLVNIREVPHTFAAEPLEKIAISTEKEAIRNEGLSDAELTEAHRIAAELAKLHRDGVISGTHDPQAVFYATLVRNFGASYTEKRSPSADREAPSPGACAGEVGIRNEGNRDSGANPAEETLF
jgi:hypothetical protein